MAEKIEQASAGVASVLNAELDRAATMNIIKCGNFTLVFMKNFVMSQIANVKEELNDCIQRKQRVHNYLK